jgi:hypothetical protein
VGASLGDFTVLLLMPRKGKAYNMGNCQIAQELFQKQPGISVKYWFEKDNFKK